MPKTNIEILLLRDNTVRAVNTIIEQGRAITEKEALKTIYDKAKRKTVITGFNINIEFYKFYQNYRNHKKKIK